MSGGRGGGVQNSLLALVDLDVPLAPDLGRGEHATGTAHVTEGGLTGTVGTTTRDTGDTGNSTTCSRVYRQPHFAPNGPIPRNDNNFSPFRQISRLPPCQLQHRTRTHETQKNHTEGPKLTSSPRLSRGLVTSLLADSVRLTLVLVHASVNMLNDIRSDRAGEDGRDGVGGAGGSAIFADDRDGRSRSHCEGFGTWT